MMRIRIVKMPAFEAALIRFDNWWNGLSRREHVLLGILAVLLAGLVLVYGVIKPLQAARAQAFADIRTYETLNARIRAAGLTQPRAPAAPPAGPMLTGAPMQIISDSSIKQNLIANAEPLPGGGVRATIGDGGYEAVMAWLADISKTSRLTVRRVAITRKPTPGHVAATVDFAP